MKKISILVALVMFSISLFAQKSLAKLEEHHLMQKLDSLSKANELQNITSIVIAHKGKTVYEKYYNGATSSTKHNTRSATKTITGTLIGIAIDKGLISSEKEKAYRFFKDIDMAGYDERKKEIKLEDLLTMSTLLECDDYNQFSRGNEERMYLVEDWVKFYWDLPIKGFPAWKKKPKESKYGRSGSYCTAGTVVLGDVVQRVSEKGLYEFADAHLFKKLSITDYSWQYTPKDVPMTGGGLSLLSSDLIKLGQLYLNDGIWNGEQIVSRGWVAKSTAPKVSIQGDIEYGYLWWLTNFGSENNTYKSYYMTGTGGNKVVVVPELDIVVVLTTIYFNGGMDAHFQTHNMLNDFIIPAIID